MELDKTFREIISKINIENFDYMTMEEFNQFADEHGMSDAEWVREWARKIINDVRGKEIILKSDKATNIDDYNTCLRVFKTDESFDEKKMREMMQLTKQCAGFVTGYLYEEFCRTAICVSRIEDYHFQIAIPEHLREFQVDFIRQEVQETLEALIDVNRGLMWEDFKGITPKVDYEILNTDETGRITGVNYILKFKREKEKAKEKIIK